MPADAPLPVYPLPLLGRRRELRTIAQTLRTGSARLVTLTGPGGVGKTHLAVVAAKMTQRSFSDGVRFVDLASLRAVSAVAPAVAAAVGSSSNEPAPEPEEALFQVLQHQHLLLLLDNFEHLLGAATWVGSLLANCPRLVVLVTSRAPLRLRWERELPVAPLAVPPARRSLTALAALRYPAVALFVARAQAAQPQFRFTDTDALDVAQLCTRLDGLPLAIELAAARMRLLSPRVLLAQLGDSLSLLAGNSRDAPERHQTLHAAIAWSYDALSSAAQRLFRSLAVCAGGCSLAAALALARPDLRDSEALIALEALCEHNLLRRQQDSAAEPRYQPLETIRAFGQEQLEQADEGEASRGRHAAWYLRLAEHTVGVPPEQRTTERRQTVDLILLERHNLRAALAWFIQHQRVEEGLRLAVSLELLWLMRGPLGEARVQLEGLLQLAAMGEPSAWRARGRALAGTLAQAQGDLPACRRQLEQAAADLELLGLRTERAAIQSELGLLARAEGDYDDAQRYLTAALASFEDVGDGFGVAYSLDRLGTVAHARGDAGTAQGFYARALSAGRAIGDPQFLAWVLQNAGFLALDTGELDRAASLLLESLDLRRQLGHRGGIAYSLAAVASLALAQGDAGRALRLAGAAERLAQEVGLRFAPWYSRRLAATQREAQERLQAALEAGAAPVKGERLTIEAALRMASARPEIGVAAAPATPLTAREREVAALIARGLTNQQIARELVIARGTVANHVEHIRAKLGVHTRAAVAAWAVATGMHRPGA